jgi:hypothetical protein
VKGPIKEVQKAVQRLRKRCGFKFIAHDLRRTAATLMADAGVPENFIPKVLNHVGPASRGGTTTCMPIAARSERRSKRGLDTLTRFLQTSSCRLGQSFRFDAEAGSKSRSIDRRWKLSGGMGWRRPQHPCHFSVRKEVSAAQHPAVPRPTASSGRPHRLSRRPPTVAVAAEIASP